jgi:hypothetical protein
MDVYSKNIIAHFNECMSSMIRSRQALTTPIKTTVTLIVSQLLRNKNSKLICITDPKFNFLGDHLYASLSTLNERVLLLKNHNLDNNLNKNDIVFYICDNSTPETFFAKQSISAENNYIIFLRKKNTLHDRSNTSIKSNYSEILVPVTKTDRASENYLLIINIMTDFIAKSLLITHKEKHEESLFS